MVFPQPRAFDLVVSRADQLTPRMRRILLTGPDLDGFSPLPGQDISLGFKTTDGSTVRRRYSIRRFDEAHKTLEIDVVMHGGGPGMRWAEAAEPGVKIDAIGPRGKITLAMDADWHLFAGDATAVPAALAMIDALPQEMRALGFFQVDGPDESQSADRSGSSTKIEWLSGADTQSSDQVARALARADLPGGRGHAYLAGEVSLVSRLKETLVAQGWSPEQISAKAYWNIGRANAGHGEPEQKVR